MRPMYLLIRVTGLANAALLLRIWTKVHEAFASRKIELRGELVHDLGTKYIFDRTRGIQGFITTPSIWLIGLDQREWCGDILRSLTDEIENETKIRVYPAAN